MSLRTPGFGGGGSGGGGLASLGAAPQLSRGGSSGGSGNTKPALTGGLVALKTPASSKAAATSEVDDLFGDDAPTPKYVHVRPDLTHSQSGEWRLT